LQNSAIGGGALNSNTGGSQNTGIGNQVLNTNTTGVGNTAVGYKALFTNTTGFQNTALGNNALFSNESGQRSVAVGYEALYLIISGSNNVALGYQAGNAFTLGESNNICLGDSVYGSVGQSAALRIGATATMTSCYIGGIRGVTTDVADGIAVLVDSKGQLGTISSSIRYKENVQDIGMVSSSSWIFVQSPLTT
jgi:hypothetical protein